MRLQRWSGKEDLDSNGKGLMWFSHDSGLGLSVKQATVMLVMSTAGKEFAIPGSLELEKFFSIIKSAYGLVAQSMKGTCQKLDTTERWRYIHASRKLLLFAVVFPAFGNI